MYGGVYSGLKGVSPYASPQTIVPIAQKLAQSLTGTSTTDQQGQSTPNQYEDIKNKWMEQAKKANPTVDDDTLGKIFDAKMSGAPLQSEEDQQDKTNQQNQIKTELKNSMTYPDQGEGSSFIKGLTRGALDAAQGIKQLVLQAGEHTDLFGLTKGLPAPLDSLALIPPQPKGTAQKYTQQVDNDIKQYEKETAAHPFAAETGRIVGNIIAMLPTAEVGGIGEAASGILPRMAEWGTQGTLMGGLEFDPSGQNRAQRALFTGLIGAVTGGTYHGAKNFLKWLVRPQTLSDDPAVLQAAANRVKEAKDIGLDRLTAGAATQDPEIMSKEIDLLKGSTDASKKFRQMHQNISSDIYNAGQKMINSIGGVNKDKVEIGSDIIASLRGTQKAAREGVSNMYQIAADAFGNDAPIDRSDIVNSIRDVQENYPADLKLSPLVKRMMGNLTEIKDFKPEDQTQDITTVANNQDWKNPFTVKDANNFIAAINKNMRSTTQPDVKPALIGIKYKIMDSLDDLSKQTDNPAASLFGLARAVRKDLGDVFDQKDIVNKLIKDKGATTDNIAPEIVMDRIFGGKENYTNLNKIKQAFEYQLPADEWITKAKELNPDTDYGKLQDIYYNKIKPRYDRNIQVWNDLRNTKLNQIYNDSTVNINGLPSIDYTKFSRNIENLNDATLDTLIGNKDIADRFRKFVNILGSISSKPKTKINIEEGSGKLKNLAVGIYSHLGGEESPVGAFVHFPFSWVRSFVNNFRDENWIRANLALGEKTEVPGMKILKKDPEMYSNIVNILRQNKAAHDLMAAIPRTALMASALTPSSYEIASRGTQ